MRTSQHKPLTMAVLFLSEEFEKEDLIFVPAKDTPPHLGKDVWVSADQCIWMKPAKVKLQHSFALSPTYRDGLYEFFVKRVGVEWTFSLSKLHYEAKMLAGPSLDGSLESLDNLSELLAEINMMLQSSQVPRSEILALKSCRMLPIRLPKSPKTKLFDKLVAASNDEEWFIADCEQFVVGFYDEAPLLALSSRRLRVIRPLLEKLGVENRLLSRTTETFSTTNLKVDGQYTAYWSLKARFIDRYV
jgi:hypothetical protein